MDTKTVTPNLLTTTAITAEINLDTFTQQPLHNLTARANSYYRSKIFTSQIGINPLITAAAPLFSIIEYLNETTSKPDLSRLHQDLSHEIKAFETQAQTQGYHSQVILAARYVLCIWLDEMILNTSWGKHSEWEKHTLSNSPQDNISNSSQFFHLLDRCCRDPEIYIDLLELMYLCLSLGFEGDYRHAEYGHRELARIVDNLYLCIKQIRGDFSKKLEVKVETTTPVKVNRSKFSLLLSITVLAITAISATAFYFMLSHRLDNSAVPVYQLIKQLANTSVL